MAGVTKQ